MGRPRIPFLLVCASLVALAACSKDPTANADAEKASAASSGAARKLTRADLDEAKKLIKPFQPWDSANAALVAKLGPPHGKDGETPFWRAIEGDKCAKLIVEKKGSEVGMNGITEVDKMAGSMYKSCVADTPEAPAAKAAPVSAALTATKLGKPLGEVAHDDVKAALERAGWKIDGATQSKSGTFTSIIVSASKGGVDAQVKIYRGGGSSWKERLVKDGAAIHEEAAALVGVIIKDRPDDAKKLLESLL